MAGLLTQAEIVERALRKCGVYAINDSGAETAHVTECLYWLDMIVANFVGEHEAYWLVPATLSISLTADQQDYVIADELGTNDPDDGILYVTEAWLEDSGGNRCALEIATRKKFESVGYPDQSGTPYMVYIDRTLTPTLKTYPTLGTGATGYTIKLIVQTNSPDMKPRSGSGLGNAAHGLRATWQLWMVYELAWNIGDGPVTKRPRTELNDWKGYADQRKRRLLSFENTEKDTEAPVTEYRDF